MRYALTLISTHSMFAFLVGLNLFAAFGAYINNTYLFWGILFFVTLSYVFARIIASWLGTVVPRWLHLVLASLLGLFHISIIVTIGFDMIILMMRFFSPSIKNYVSEYRVYIGILGSAITILLFFIGLINAYRIKYTTVNISTKKPLPGKIRIAFVADVHILSFTSKRFLTQMVRKINALNADLVIIGGDIVDGEVYSYKKRGASRIFKKINSRHGVYVILGNHEYTTGDVDTAVEDYVKTGFNMLIDKTVYIEPIGVYLTGRDDYMGFMKKRERKPVSELLHGADKNKPLIVVDHQPSEFNKLMAEGVDIALSGHTHGGQIFPMNLIAKLVFKNYWGIWKRGQFTSVVSCGVGFWGAPVRLGTYAEIMNIEIESVK